MLEGWMDGMDGIVLVYPGACVYVVISICSFIGNVWRLGFFFFFFGRWFEGVSESVDGIELVY